VKRCNICGRIKAEAEFYSHPSSYDGLHPSCKPCVKAKAKANYHHHAKDQNWVAKERERCRIKAKKYRDAGRAKIPTYAQTRKWEKANPKKKYAQKKAGIALRRGLIAEASHCEMCGSKPPDVKHHHDYSRPLEIIWLCHACHGAAHRKRKTEPRQR